MKNEQKISQETSCFDMKEESELEIVCKIDAMATSIRNDWTDPRAECREIFRLCDLLKKKLVGINL